MALISDAKTTKDPPKVIYTSPQVHSASGYSVSNVSEGDGGKLRGIPGADFYRAAKADTPPRAAHRGTNCGTVQRLARA